MSSSLKEKGNNTSMCCSMHAALLNIDSHGPWAPAPYHSTGLCPRLVLHTFHLPLIAPHSETPGYQRVPSAGRCSSPQNGHSHTEACPTSWTWHTAPPVKEIHAGIEIRVFLQHNYYIVWVFSACVVSLLYQNSGNTQGFVCQGVCNVGCLAFVRLCHI